MVFFLFCILVDRPMGGGGGGGGGGYSPPPSYATAYGGWMVCEITNNLNALYCKDASFASMIYRLIPILYNTKP